MGVTIRRSVQYPGPYILSGHQLSMPEHKGAKSANAWCQNTIFSRKIAVP